MEVELNNVKEEDSFLPKFNPKTMIYSKWINKFEYKFKCNKMNDFDKVKSLVTMLEPRVFVKIQKEAFPFEPLDCSYDEVIAMLEKTCSQFQGKEVAISRYLNREQYPNENADHYVVALKNLFDKCPPDFKSTNSMKKHFINGLIDEKTKILLQKDDNMKLSMAVYVARQREISTNQNNSQQSF